MAKDVDWDAVEREYRAGIKTIREIGNNYGVSHTAVKQRADKFGWVRNLNAKIKAKSDDILSKANFPCQLSKITEQEIIETNANLQATVLLTEREDIKRLSGLSEKFEGELAAYQEDLERKARIMKSLTETRKIIIELRRRNYGITDNANGDAPAQVPLPATDHLTAVTKKLNENNVHVATSQSPPLP